MKLSDLVAHVDATVVRGSLDRDVRRVTRDSRTVGDQDVFVALPGTRVDGHDFVSGLQAAAVVVERDVAAQPGVTVLRVADTRIALAQLAASIHGEPAAALKVVGITGTNGKTTVTTLVDEALRRAGRRSGRVGTTGTSLDGRPVASALTTPMADDLQALFADMVDAGIAFAAIEVSSIGVDQHRVAAIPFHTAVFTNLGWDHIEYHGSVEAYRDCKARLFRDLLRPAGGPPRALLCADDPAWTQMSAPGDRWLYGFADDADIRIDEMAASSAGMALALSTPMGPTTVHSPLVGRFNAQNLAAALGVMLTLGVDLGEAGAALGGVDGVPGRLEAVPNDRGFAVFVDYAHTPDALAAVLESVVEVTPGRTWCIFGCGGNRDAAKRPQMGKVVSELADMAVVTSDNPRDEDPQSIIDAILPGMEKPPAHVDTDRASAIRWTLRSAAKGDAVVIAGKGHETTQEISGIKHPFDDRVVARDALEALP